MKSLKIFAMLIALITAAWMIQQKTFAQQGPDSYQVFYDNLSPYGEWAEDPNYGYVWIPDVDAGFTPYATNGHWVYTDDGWTWVSDYPWGWAAFHYGRWENDNAYGWFWVPDNEWGPAWVSWRRSPGYYGWAPLRPGISISVSFGDGYHEQDNRWMFVRDRDIDRSDISSRYIDRGRNVTIINNSTVIINERRDDRRNGTYIAGPDRNDVQKVTHTTIQPVAIRENNRPGQHLDKGEMQIYRPQVQKTSDNGRKPVPSKVVKLTDVKPAGQRNQGNQQWGVNPANDNRKQPQNVVPNNNNAKQPQNINQGDNRLKQQQNAAPNNNKGRQPQNVNPNNNNARQQQNTNQNNNKLKQQQSMPPSNNRIKQTPDAAPSNNRGKQPLNVNPNNNRIRQQESVNPNTNKVKPSQSTAPANNRGRQPQSVAPSANRGKQPQSIAPSNSKGKQQQNVVPPGNKGKQPQNVAPSGSNQPKQDGKKPDEKKKQDQ